MAQNTDEMATIVIRDDCDECVTRTTANSHHRQKSSDAVVRSTCRRENYACGPWERYPRFATQSTKCLMKPRLIESVLVSYRQRLRLDRFVRHLSFLPIGSCL
jgi:hypothetical protein